MTQRKQQKIHTHNHTCSIVSG